MCIYNTYIYIYKCVCMSIYIYKQTHLHTYRHWISIPFSKKDAVNGSSLRGHRLESRQDARLTPAGLEPGNSGTLALGRSRGGRILVDVGFGGQKLK